MKNNLVEWKKPIIKSATFEEIANYVKAMAQSGGTSCIACNSMECISCSCVSCSCSCSAKCDPLALYWSCGDFFIGVGSTDDKPVTQ